MEITKERIIAELKRTAVSGIRLSTKQFTAATQIKAAQWERFGNLTELAAEVGLQSPEKMTRKYEHQELIAILVRYMEKYDEFPEMRKWRRRRSELDLPPFEVIQRNVGMKKSIIARSIVDYCQQKIGLDKIIEMSLPFCLAGQNDLERNKPVGEVYLFRAGRNYTIGKANNAIVRHYQHQRGNAEELKIVATIKSAFPFAVESYWHSRFKSKRIRPSWYKLDKEDVDAFKSGKFPE